MNAIGALIYLCCVIMGKITYIIVLGYFLYQWSQNNLEIEIAAWESFIFMVKYMISIFLFALLSLIIMDEKTRKSLN